MIVAKREVLGKPIFIVDDAITLDGINGFYKFISNLPYTKKEVDDAADEFPIFSVTFQVSKFEDQTEVGAMGRQLLNELRSDKYELHRAYINMCHYGDMEYPHMDCQANEEDITVLYYANTKWDYTWGGETQFYEKMEVVSSISPKPGRFVLFDGNIEHVGTIPTRVCKESRLTLAMKYSKKEN